MRSIRLSDIFLLYKIAHTQKKSRLSTKEQSREYIHFSWMSEDFLSNDLKSVNISQPTSIIDPKFTFLDKFLEKRLQRKIVKGLIDQRLIPPDAVKTNTFTLKFNELSNTQLDILSEAIHNELYKNDDS